jgi:hypothetical protein
VIDGQGRQAWRNQVSPLDGGCKQPDGVSNRRWMAAFDPKQTLRIESEPVLGDERTIAARASGSGEHPRSCVEPLGAGKASTSSTATWLLLTMPVRARLRAGGPYVTTGLNPLEVASTRNSCARMR